MRGVLLAACAAFAIAGCGGGGGGSTAAPATATQQGDGVPSPAAAPTPAPAAAPEPAPPVAAIDPERVLYQSRLVHWFTSPPEGKRVVWVGDSTTYLMDIVANGGLWRVNDDYMNTYVNPPGGALHGVVNVWMGANGNPLDWFLKNGPVGMGLSDVIAADGDLYVFSYGINDVREGRRNQQQLTADIITAIDAIRAARPNADIVLRTPNSFLTTDAAGLHFVTPITAAQEYTDILRNSYLSVKDRWERSQPRSGPFTPEVARPCRQAKYANCVRVLL